MSLWLRKTNELEAHAFKWAVGGSIFVYVFLVLGLFLCFKPQRTTVSLVVPRSTKAAVVSFYSGKKGNGGRRSGRNSLQGRAAALARLRRKKGHNKEVVAPAVSKITEKKRAAERREQERIKKVREQKELAQKQRREKERAAEEAKLKEAIRVEKKKQSVKPSVVDSKKSESLSKKVEPVVPLVKSTPVAQKKLAPKAIEKPPSPPVEPEKELVAEAKMEEKMEDEEVEKSTDLVEEFGIMEGMEGVGNEDFNGDGDGNGEDGYSREGAALVRSISRAWRPPRGLSPALSARLIVWLKSDGHIEKIVVDKKSGVLAFDMAAKASLWRTDFPQAFWGKNIAVFFGRMDE